MNISQPHPCTSDIHWSQPTKPTDCRSLNTRTDEIIGTLCAQVTNRQLVPGSIAWQEMENVVRSLDVQAIGQLFDKCWKCCESDNKMAYSFIALLKMTFNRSIQLPDLVSCDFAHFNDELQQMYRAKSIEHLFFGNIMGIDFSQYPDQKKIVTFFLYGLHARPLKTAQWALKRGNLKLFEEVRQQAPEGSEFFINYLAIAAVKSEKQEIMEYVKALGLFGKNSYELMVSAAIKKKNLIFLQFIMEEFFSSILSYKRSFIFEAAQGGNMEILRYLLVVFQGNVSLDDWHSIVKCAAKSGNMDIVLFAMAKAGPLSQYALSSIACDAVCGGNLEVVKHIVLKGREAGSEWECNEMASLASTVTILQYVIELAPKGHKWDFQEIAEKIARAGRWEVFNYLISSFGSDNFIWNSWLLRAAEEGRNRKCIEFVQKSGDFSYHFF